MSKSRKFCSFELQHFGTPALCVSACNAEVGCIRQWRDQGSLVLAGALDIVQDVERIKCLVDFNELKKETTQMIT